MAVFDRRLFWKDHRTNISRGSKSRNKVSVGEPAEGSSPYLLVQVFRR